MTRRLPLPSSVSGVRFRRYYVIPLNVSSDELEDGALISQRYFTNERDLLYLDRESEPCDTSVFFT